MQEFNIINTKFKPLANHNIAARGLADDVAKISLKKDEELVISKDLMVEDVHFLRQDGGFKIAAKLLLSNLSDLAAAGAKPAYYMLGFSKNKQINNKFLEDFTKGLKSVQDEFKLDLIGGDTVSSEKLFFSITIFGIIKKDKILSRDAAKDGDLIFVSGNIGDAFLGLQIKQNPQLKSEKKSKEYLLNRHFFPTPRISLAQNLLQKNLSKCAIDVSDGLFSDLRHICQESKLDAEIFLEKIPLSLEAKIFLEKNPQINILDLLSGGDDYELIFSTNQKNKKKVFNLARQLNLDITAIGRFIKNSNKKSEIALYDQNNNQIKIKKFGYEH